MKTKIRFVIDTFMATIYRPGRASGSQREHIEDIRSGFLIWLETRHHGRRPEYPYRIETAGLQYFEELQQWHKQHGSLDVKVG